MKKLIFVFIILSMLVVITGCNARKSNTIHFDPKIDGVTTKAEGEVSNTGTTSITEESVGPGLAVTSFAGDKLEINKSYQVIKGTTPKNTYKIKVNDYTLTKYSPGQTEWSYIASTKYSTLKTGENAYKAVAYDKDGNEISSTDFNINYVIPPIPVLPAVGPSVWIAFILSFILSGVYFGLKRFKRIYANNN
jgi:hypothetical protein